jgi:8-oxo-dGTP diphosphatase
LDNVSPFFDAVQQSKQHTSEPNSANPMAQYETPLVTVDIVVYTIHQDALKVLLFQRQQEPYQGMWSIPGGFIYEGEALEKAAARWLSLKTKVSDIFLEQLGAFGTPSRDP